MFGLSIEPYHVPVKFSTPVPGFRCWQTRPDPRRRRRRQVRNHKVLRIWTVDGDTVWARS